MEFNERKYVILSIVSELEEATSYDVFVNLDPDDDVSLSAVQMALLRYHRQGLLFRKGGKEKIPGSRKYNGFYEEEFQWII